MGEAGAFPVCCQGVLKKESPHGFLENPCQELDLRDWTLEPPLQAFRGHF